MTIDHDLAATLRDLAAVRRWDDHCSRDARSVMGGLAVPSYTDDAADAAPPPRLPDDGDGRDIDWTRASTLRRILVTLSPASQAVLWALVAGCPQGTQVDAAAQVVAREVLRGETLRPAPDDATCGLWRRLEVARDREATARRRHDAAQATVAVGRRRRDALDTQAIAEALAARQALDAATASRAAADGAWLAHGRAMLAAAVAEWRTARECERIAA